MVVEITPSRGDVFLVSLNPTQGLEMQKTRPCVVVSPDELNAHMGTFIVAPMTTGAHAYPFQRQKSRVSALKHASPPKAELHAEELAALLRI